MSLAQLEVSSWGGQGRKQNLAMGEPSLQVWQALRLSSSNIFVPLTETHFSRARAWGMVSSERGPPGPSPVTGQACLEPLSMLSLQPPQVTGEGAVGIPDPHPRFQAPSVRFLTFQGLSCSNCGGPGEIKSSSSSAAVA
jgi:hypothetical protein